MIKSPEDYEIAAYIFEHLEVRPNHDGTREALRAIVQYGVVAVCGATLAASPMHQLQKEVLDPSRVFSE